MNDRLLNNPIPPREVNPAISPQLQEIIYRALERDPKNRYPNAHEFALDLEHPEKVGVADRAELDELEAKTLAGAAASSVLHHAGADSRGRLRTDVAISRAENRAFRCIRVVARFAVLMHETGPALTAAHSDNLIERPWAKPLVPFFGTAEPCLQDVAVGELVY